MKVLFISHVANKYGAGRSLLDLLKELRKYIKSYVILPFSGEMQEDLERLNIEYKIIPFKWWMQEKKYQYKKFARFIYNIISSFRIAKQAKIWQVDVIYSNSSVTPIGAIVAYILKKPHIWQVREFGKEHYNLIFDWGEKISHKLMDKLSKYIIVISKALKEKYVRYIPSEKVKVIYPGVNLEESSFKLKEISQKEKIYTIVIIGVLHPNKGQREAILACAELHKLNIKVKLIIAGNKEANYLHELKNIALKNKIDKYVEFKGYVKNPAQVIYEADIVLVCSHNEAFGRVAVEAMLLKKPVIGTRSGATPELIKENFNGLLYETENYQELALKIKYLIEHPDLAKQMGINGYKYAKENFTPTICANKTLEILAISLKAK